MKKINFIIFFMVIGVFLSCKETINQPDAPATETVTLKFELANNQTVYDLDAGEARIEYYLTNLSDKEIFIPAKLYGRGILSVTGKVQHFRNNNWITDYEFLSDSLISIEPQSSIKDLFYVDQKGEWRVIIPVIDQDSIYSKEIFIINNIEENVTFNINQIPGANSVAVYIKNETDESFELWLSHYGYCHFDYLHYELFENNIYKPLYWDDYLFEWNLVGTPLYVRCMQDMPPITIESGEVYLDTVYVDLPSGNIEGKVWLHFGEDWFDSEAISKIFEYQKY